MLLQNRPSVSLRAILIAALLSLFLVGSANYFIFPSYRYHPFSYHSSCPETINGTHCVASDLNYVSIDVRPAPPTVTVTVPLKTVTVMPPTLAATVVTVTSIATSTVVKEVKASGVPAVTAIPQKLWYKLGAMGLKDDAKEWIDSCLHKNPTYRHEFLTDASGDYYVQEYYSHRPDIVETYMALPIPILKADFLRYLILYAEGGIWSDLDVSCEDAVIPDWIPERYKEKTSLVVGLEFDMGWEGDDYIHSQFASWTIMCKPGSPHMKQVIEDILDGLHGAADKNKASISELTLDMTGDVVDMTGPKRMTLGIIKSLRHELDVQIDDRNISKLHEPALVGDVLVLPGMAFAGSQNGFPDDQGKAFVTHHYSGSWKNHKGGELTDAEQKIKDAEDKKKEEEKKAKEQADKKKEEADKKKEEAEKKKKEEEESKRLKAEEKKKEEEDKQALV